MQLTHIGGQQNKFSIISTCILIWPIRWTNNEYKGLCQSLYLSVWLVRPPSGFTDFRQAHCRSTRNQWSSFVLVNNDYFLSWPLQRPLWLVSFDDCGQPPTILSGITDGWSNTHVVPVHWSALLFARFIEWQPQHQGIIVFFFSLESFLLFLPHESEFSGRFRNCKRSNEITKTDNTKT